MSKVRISKEIAAMAAPKAKSNQFLALLNYFPTQSLLYVFGYGPGMAPENKQNQKKVPNIVFVVDDPILWHRKNLGMNPSHYSFLKYFGTRAICKIQENWACGIYHNPLVNVNNKLINYGVISKSAIYDDLVNWRHMYMAGVLHSPVVDLRPPICPLLVSKIKQNQLTALRTVLLQLPPQASKYELYYGIASLSYTGDFRVYIDDDPLKIKDMILPMVSEFDAIYLPLIDSLNPIVTMDKAKTMILQKNAPELNLAHLLALPSTIQIHLAQRFKFNLAHLDVEEVMINLSKVRHIDMYVLQSISKKVRKSKIAQTAQDCLTAGLFKSVWSLANRIEEKLSPFSERVEESYSYKSSKSTVVGSGSNDKRNQS